MDTDGSSFLSSVAFKILSCIGGLYVLRLANQEDTDFSCTAGAAETQVRESICQSLQDSASIYALLLFCHFFFGPYLTLINLPEQRCIILSSSLCQGTHKWPCLDRKILTKGGKMAIFGLSGRQQIVCYSGHQSSKFPWSM